MNKKLKVIISILALILIGALTYRGVFVRDVLITAILFAISLGSIELIDREISKGKK